MNKKIILAAVAFVVVVAVFLTVYFVTRPKGNEDLKTVTVTVTHGDGSKNKLTIETNREFLADALIDEGLFTAQDIASGMTNTVDGETADAALEQWWCVYADGKMPDFGMKEVPLVDCSKYELVFTVGYDMFY